MFPLWHQSPVGRSQRDFLPVSNLNPTKRWRVRRSLPPLRQRLCLHQGITPVWRLKSQKNSSPAPQRSPSGWGLQLQRDERLCPHSFNPFSFTCFQKRKAETEPSEKEGDAQINEDAPEDDVKEVKKEEEVQSSPAEPEQKQEDVTQSGIQSKRPKAANPYGSWERIKVEKDP